MKIVKILLSSHKSLWQVCMAGHLICIRERDHLAIILRNLDLPGDAVGAQGGGSVHLDGDLAHHLEGIENATENETEGGAGNATEIVIVTVTGTGTGLEIETENGTRTEIQIAREEKRVTGRVKGEMMVFLCQRKKHLVVCC